MKRFALVLCLFLAPALATAQTPEAPPAIQFPAIPAAPLINPTAPAKLDAGVMYVVTFDTELWGWSFPEGLLSITQEVGPLRIRGVFADSGGKVETRTYKGKHILIVEAVGTGRASLLVLPAGAKAQSQGLVKAIDANVGPRPPPPDPDPVPPPVDAFTRSVMDAYALEAQATRQEYTRSLAALFRATTTGLDANAYPDVKTYADLFAKMKAAKLALGIPAGSLPHIMAVIGADENATFGKGSSGKAIDRALIRAEFTKIAAALEAAAK